MLLKSVNVCAILVLAFQVASAASFFQRKWEFETANSNENLRYDVSLDTEGRLHLFWDTDIVAETITFRLEAQIQPQETLAFGFSDYGESENADLIVYWRDATGKRHFQVSLERSANQIYSKISCQLLLHPWVLGTLQVEWFSWGGISRWWFVWSWNSLEV